MIEIKKDFNEAHQHKCNTISEKDMEALVNKAIDLIEPEIKKQFYYFRDNDICISDFLSYVMNIVCTMSGFFISNSINAAPDMEFPQHVIAVVKGICMYHGITLVDHSLEKISDSLH